MNDSDLKFHLQRAFYPSSLFPGDVEQVSYFPGFAFTRDHGTPDPSAPKPDVLAGIPTTDVHIHTGNHYDYEPPDVINILINLKKNANYLEIGVDQGHTFDNIKNTNLKHGVDPYGASENITHKMTSQLFFAMNNRFFKQKYDVVFIDGMHLVEFIYAEILESLHILKKDGFIVLHDTCPYWEPAQLVLESDYKRILNTVISPKEKERLKWHENVAKSGIVGHNGDAWKIVPFLRTLEKFTVFSIPNACITVISTRKIAAFEPKRGILTPKDLPSMGIVDLPWEYYFHNFEKIMNPYTMDYFKKNIGEWCYR